jgi:hypothetical protein
MLHISFRDKLYKVSPSIYLGVPPPSRGLSLNDWWDEMIAAISKEDRRSASEKTIYFVRGWRGGGGGGTNTQYTCFLAKQPLEVAKLVDEDIDQCAFAHISNPRDTV